MTSKGKSRKGSSASDLPVSVSKPAFEAALSFAEAGQPPVPAVNAVAAPVQVAPTPAPTPTPISTPTQTPTSTPASTAPILQASSLMPADDVSRRVLRERAQALAKVAHDADDEASEQYLRFRLGAVEHYGIPYTFLQELLHVGNLARVPCTPASIAGVVNHRGELLTVIDLKHFFRIEPVPVSGETRIVVVQHGAVRAGILVDEVDGNEAYRSTDLAPPLRSEGVTNMEHVIGIHQGSVTMLNIGGVLSDPALRVVQTV